MRLEVDQIASWIVCVAVAEKKGGREGGRERKRYVYIYIYKERKKRERVQRRKWKLIGWHGISIVS